MGRGLEDSKTIVETQPMNITLRQLRAFVSIGDLGSFTKAANALHATQPALSAQINQLEECLGVRLFDRSTRSVALTQVGRDLLPVVDKVLSDLQAVAARARDISQKNTGRVTVAALPSISSTLLPRAIADFHQSFPGISIGLKDAVAERIVEMIRSDEVDFGISLRPTEWCWCFRTDTGWRKRGKSRWRTCSTGR
ncbi:MAG: LysR family transcriptional regulator [Betaproteobacteria bacterium]|nr:MAG: LysR family transcriptional regulator [Betaproteobacteria bacterium]